MNELLLLGVAQLAKYRHTCMLSGSKGTEFMCATYCGGPPLTSSSLAEYIMLPEAKASISDIPNCVIYQFIVGAIIRSEALLLLRSSKMQPHSKCIPEMGLEKRAMTLE